jgi:hypothetical protein
MKSVSCENDNKLSSSSTEERIRADFLGNWKFLNKDSAPWGLLVRPVSTDTLINYKKIISAVIPNTNKITISGKEIRETPLKFTTPLSLVLESNDSQKYNRALEKENEDKNIY